MQTLVKNVNIAGIATCVPERQVDVFDNKNIYGGNIKKLNKVVNGTGFHKRHVLNEKSETTAGDLCLKAARALFDTGIEKDDVGAIIVVTQYPDYFGPATACVLHGKLGLKQDCLAFDINQGCSGYIYGLFVAGSLINRTSGKILLLAGDTPTKSSGTKEDAVDDMPIFGDGGSATILEYCENASPMFFEIGTKGDDFEAIIARNGAFRNMPSPGLIKNGKFDYGHEMDGLKVFDFTMNIVPPSINHVMARKQSSDEQTDYYIMHQANKMILENIAASAEINVDKVLRKTLSEYGNLSCASIPSVICDEYEKFDKRKNNVVLSGFGVGLSWGSVALELNNPLVLPIIYC